MNSSRFPSRSACLAICALWFCPAQTGAAPKLEVRVLSSRPEMVSGGDALVEVRGASGGITAALNGKDITSAFRAGRAPGAWIGRIQGLSDAANTIAVKAGRKKARLQIVNHSRKGPIFSGPHQKPFVCETEAVGLGPALDSDCSAETKVQYFYKSTQPPAPDSARPGQSASPFKPFDSSLPRPSDLAQTTTSEGKTVDYIVRRETGTINRAVYDIAILHTPGQPLPDPWTPSPNWNGRLVYSFGGGCSAGYRQGRSPSALNDSFLSLGYASAASSLNVFGNNCDDVISAETLMMVKEHFIEEFGPPVYTIGWGGSGGSMQQHLISQNYPGMLDGILPASSYPDITTVIPSTVDCTLLSRAFDASGQAWTDEQKTAVSGYATWKTCGSWMRYFSPGWLVAGTCPPVVPKTMVYSPATPGGARCGIYDNEVNVYGRDPATGFARRALDNVGVQYGLVAFNAGKITSEQFVTLNERVGGYDRDGNPVPARTTADLAALRLAYQTGRVQAGRGALATIPILDSRPWLDASGDIHDSYRSLATRARLTKANGGAANHVIWTTGRKVPDAAGTAEKLRAVDQWLANIHNDPANDAAAVKVVRNKPPGLTDACWTESGEKVTDAAKCEQLYPASANPRIAAGAPLADDVLKCSLRPIDPGAYRQSLSAEQLARLKAVFPQGVCDYSRPGIEQQNAHPPWRRY